ncbi:MAG TPA: methyl-accepting chemotaxis protein, partial [Thermoanaerobaculia bacterium]
MPFTRRYLLWLLIPPAVVTVPPAIAFLAQVVFFSGAQIGILAALIVVMYAVGGIVFTRAVEPKAQAVEDAAARGGDVSRAASACLQTTARMSLLLWGIGGVIFAIAGTLLVMPSSLGFSYFLTAAMIAVFPSVIWGYAMGKHQLTHFGATQGKLRYSGRELSLKTKIAVIFIGAFILSAVTLVLLVSSKVSTTLEALAINSAAERFQRLYDSANVLARMDAASLDTLKIYIPAEYAIHHIDNDGKLTSTKDPLSEEEVAHIRRIKNGDSTSFISAHVSRFSTLRDGSILVLAIPWAPYRHIPYQITFYTLVIALLTTIMFSVATWFLARDVTRPLRELRALARQMAEGNFDAETRVFSDDEVGQLADSFGETRENLRRLLGRIGGQGSTITDGVRVITGGTESLLLRSRDQAELTESSSLAVENVRGGIGGVLGAADTVNELTQDASSRALELQASAEEVARSMDYLFQSVEKTSSSTTEMNASMVEMSKRTDVLAGIGDEVLSFVAQMDSTITELRSTSHATADIAQRVREDAEAGGAAVHRTVEGINASQELTNSTAEVLDELQRSVGEISQILNVIEDVANRTNLLSLNAAIIAAQAGEHGAGFTVVADEIRQLAERTRGSTK